MIKNKLPLALLCTAVLFIGSCADENITDNNHGNKGGMSFEVSDVQDAPEDNPQSRSIAAADPIGSIPFNESIAADACLQETTIDGVNPVKRTPETRAFLKSTIDADFGVSASKNGSNQADYFYNERVSNTGVMVNPKVWSSDASSLKFYAIYPYMDGSNSNQKLVQASANALPTVDFTASTDIANQTDLMSAVTNEITYTPSSGGAAHVVPLKFRHALTAIRFGVGSNLSWGKTIKSVEFQNIHNKGNYNPATHTWTTGSTTANFKLDNINVLTNGTLNNVILKDGNTFLMVPQTLPSGAKIVITFNDGTSITAKIEGGKWKPGTTKTYMMTEKNSNWEYVLESTSPVAVEYNISQTGAYTITSYRKVGTEQQPVSWQVVGYDANGDNNFSMEEKPSWLTSLTTTSGNGGTVAESGTATLKTTEVIDYLEKRNKELKEADAKGTPAAPYNLSNANGGNAVENTANCYVISAPGSYRIPLVYGNAITGGTPNTTSYISSAPPVMAHHIGDIILHNFKDHNNQDITDPWITQTNGSTYTPNGGKVVWSDASGIVTNIGVTGSGANAFLKFDVPATAIKCGNAVVAVTDASNTILWSWHLWFTSPDALKTITCTNFQNKDYNLTAETLGWTFTKWRATTYDSPREVVVKVRQSTGNNRTPKEATITITQNNVNEKDGYSTIYQFGRKDAFLGTATSPSLGTPIEGTISKVSYFNMRISDGIRNPDKLYGFLSSSDRYYIFRNLWSINNTVTTNNDDKVIKTIYDPCPAGFKLPSSNAFTGFSKNGQNGATGNMLNISKKFSLGYDFYNKITSPNATISFPPASFDLVSGGAYFWRQSIYWTAIPYKYPHDEVMGRTMSFSTYQLDVNSWHSRDNACSIRPIADKNTP